MAGRGGLVSALAVGAAPAHAEWFGDLYLGGAFTENSDLTAKGSFNGTAFEITGRDLRFARPLSVEWVWPARSRLRAETIGDH